MIFPCRDRNVFLIYHPLPCLGLLLKSVLFLFKNMFAFFNHVLPAIIEPQTHCKPVGFPTRMPMHLGFNLFLTVPTSLKLLL